MSTLNQLYNTAYTAVWENDSARMAQQRYLEIIAELRHVDCSVLQTCRMMFLPNDSYLSYFAGNEICYPEFGCYSSPKECIWVNQLIIPITNIVGEVKGFAAFHPFNYATAKETGDKTITYYSYSARDVFAKNKFLYCPGDSYRKALDDGYIFLVDGVFDAASLYCAGFNAGALMGSIPSPEIIMLLRFIKRVILVADNDEAGYKLYQTLARKLNNIELYKQGFTKDADELLKSDRRDEFVASLKSVLDTGGFLKISVL